MSSRVTVCPACGVRNRVPVSARGGPQGASCHAPLPERLAARFDARSIPTLGFVSGGVVVERIVGAQPAQVLARRIDAVLTG